MDQPLEPSEVNRKDRGGQEIFVRSVTPKDLERLVRMARASGLNRSPEWRIGGGKAFIEQSWSNGASSVEVRPDRSYFLFPMLWHNHRGGQPTAPHYRCRLYIGSEADYEQEDIVIDVFLSDYNQLPILGAPDSQNDV